MNNSTGNIRILLISMHKNIQYQMEYTNIQESYTEIKVNEYP